MRWAGSKRRLVPVLRDYWGEREARYVEPFAGSACLFFDLEPTKAILGDINGDLIETYQVIRTNPAEVYRRLSRMTNSAVNYYRVRRLDPNCLTPMNRAARFIYLNRYCFNGLYRTNLAGAFNVPYGGYKSGTLPTLQALRKAGELLTNAELIAGDFARILEKVSYGDFVYLDPPYRVTNRRVFGEYDASIFSTEDLQRLRAWLEELTRRNIEFLLSYAESAEARVLSDGFNVRRIRVRRNIAGFTGSRRVASEMLISNAALFRK